MTGRKIFFAGAAVIATGMFLASRCAGAQEQARVVRMAELTIDAAQLDAYKVELKREIETSIRIEPGVLTLYAVAVKDHSDQIRIFEIYRDQVSYQAHLLTPHFKRYKSATQGMVKDLKLIETEPIVLGSK